MTKTNVTITFGAALLLRDVINRILVEEVVDDKGNKKFVNRKLPFRLSYRLNRNMTSLDKYVDIFNGKKMYLFAAYGTMTEDGKDVILADDEARKNYTNSLAELMKTPIEHNLITLEEDDIDQIKDFIDIAPEAMKLFTAYLMADQDLIDNLSKDIKVNLPKVN